MFGNNGINFGLGVDYSMVKDLDDSKAHFVGGSTEFDSVCLISSAHNILKNKLYASHRPKDHLDGSLTYR